jgi:hypothetical protein
MQSAIVFAALVFAAVGCTKSTTAEPDAGITFMVPDDGGFDAGFDAGSTTVMGTIGIECASDADCDTMYCIPESEGFRGGYCTAGCVTDEECPMGSACIPVGGGGSMGGLCFDVCDPSAPTRDCRAGYGCLVDFTLPYPVCYPGCSDDTDCPEGRTCNPERLSCFNPDGVFGSGCAASSDCPDGMRCSGEDRGYPGGMCTAFGCDVTANTGCPADGQCIPGRTGSTFGRCLDGCATDADCREDYRCGAVDAYPDRLHCIPNCMTAEDCPMTGLCDSTTGRCTD